LLEVCDRCGGSVKVIAYIEDQNVIDRILAHLREKQQHHRTLSHLVPPSRAPLSHYLFSQDANLESQISKDATEERLVRKTACYRAGVQKFLLCDHLSEQLLWAIGGYFEHFSSSVSRISKDIS
jgi:hypothetical protein